MRPRSSSSDATTASHPGRCIASVTGRPAQGRGPRRPGPDRGADRPDPVPRRGLARSGGAGGGDPRRAARPVPERSDEERRAGPGIGAARRGAPDRADGRGARDRRWTDVHRPARPPEHRGQRGTRRAPRRSTRRSTGRARASRSASIRSRRVGGRRGARGLVAPRRRPGSTCRSPRIGSRCTSNARCARCSSVSSGSGRNGSARTRLPHHRPGSYPVGGRWTPIGDLRADAIVSIAAKSARGAAGGLHRDDRPTDQHADEIGGDHRVLVAPCSVIRS